LKSTGELILVFTKDKDMLLKVDFRVIITVLIGIFIIINEKIAYK